jgi:hypothetical protein
MEPKKIMMFEAHPQIFNYGKKAWREIAEVRNFSTLKTGK